MKGPSAQTRYMLALVVDSTGNGMYLPLSLLFFHHITGLPLEEVGGILSAAALLALVSNPVAGVLVDRFGARAVVVGGYFVRAVGFAAYPLVQSPIAMFLAVALVALGDVSFPPAIQSFVAEIAQDRARDRLLAAQRSFRNAGLGAGGLIASAALGLGSDAAFTAIVLFSAAAFLCSGSIMWTIRISRTSGPASRDREQTRKPAAREREGYRLVLRNRPFMRLTFLNVPSAFGYMVLSVSLPIYITQTLGASKSMVGMVYAVNTVGIALLQIPVTQVLVRYRRTRVAALGIMMFAVSFVLFAVLGLTLTGPVLMAGVFAATALFTLGELFHGATASALVASAAPEETRGRHIAVYQLSWAIPIALAPTVLTALLTLSATGMWLLLAAGVTGSAITLLRLEPRLPAEAVQPAPPPPAEESGEPKASMSLEADA